ncbi:arsenite methyltransferase [Marinigracilibium pacificum]|uniref:Arsenite methyltransferase n=1 Tax=Marinigracilibium pacificum TaxID=2729599 RepID=A0A848J5U4_9BACT|nr:arsenite methyltransferase [Marinigracilibium pacificum]NMM49890.1 arsenite methyltransferase [Marinigracilibium pacificum]
MKTPEELKQIVREKYSEIAENDQMLNAASCCGATDASKEVYNIMTDDYSELEGYNNDADLGLGCGLPTQFANIQKGDTVIDLGSGAGNDCFVARHETGESGKVIGIDFTPKMIEKARINAEKLSFNNVEFRQGDIEDMPVSDGVADVIVSNCVLNLVPDKQKVFSEIFRVLKDTGHFSISDIVLDGDLPEALKEDAEMYAGCVSGAIQKNDYLEMIKNAGFRNITLQKQKPINIPGDILEKYLSADEIAAFNKTKGIYSITVYGEKGGKKIKRSLQNLHVKDVSENNEACCEPGSGCC